VKICILIPSFNEAKTVGWLVKSARQMGYSVLVVDDGSQDATAALAAESGAEVIVNSQNMGKGASLRRAFDMLKIRDLDAVIMMDGDGQHLPSDIPQFVSCFEKSHPGLIVGNRMAKSKGMPFIRWMTNAGMSFLISTLCRQSVPDTQCGFRLIDNRLLRMMRLATDNFEIESEMLLEAARAGFLIKSVPISTVYEGQYSAIHPVKDTLRFFRFLFRRR
jgi:glycosyltransferase involved in cell wall biosynthesis